MDTDDLPEESEEVKARKALAALCDTARPVEERYAELLELDCNNFITDSQLPPECVMSIWTSGKVRESWKLETLKRLMKSQFYGVMFVPLDCEFGNPLNRDILELIRDHRFDELEGSAFADRLAEAERTVEGFWSALLRQLLYTEDYDDAYASANRSLHKGIAFIEGKCPGTVASLVDSFGNNALMYTLGALLESNPCYSARTQDGIETAKTDMEFLQRLGCSPETKNVFGISPTLMMRWMA